MTTPVLKFIHISISNHVAYIELNRPEKANALNAILWQEITDAFQWLDTCADARVAILLAKGEHFTSGIDLEFLAGIRYELATLPEDGQRESLRNIIVQLQASVSAIEKCSKPVIAAVHGACIGGGMGLITACDMRYSTIDARFSVREVDLAIVADLGTLQRLPGLVSEGMARELAFTGRDFGGEEACNMGLVSRTCPNRKELLQAAEDVARTIAEKSPLAIRGIKETMNYSRDNGVEKGLQFIAGRNAEKLLSRDLEEVFQAIAEKRSPEFL